MKNIMELYLENGQQEYREKILGQFKNVGGDVYTSEDKVNVFDVIMALTFKCNSVVKYSKKKHTEAYFQNYAVYNNVELYKRSIDDVPVTTIELQAVNIDDEIIHATSNFDEINSPKFVTVYSRIFDDRYEVLVSIMQDNGYLVMYRYLTEVNIGMFAKKQEDLGVQLRYHSTLSDGRKIKLAATSMYDVLYNRYKNVTINSLRVNGVDLVVNATVRHLVKTLDGSNVDSIEIVSKETPKIGRLTVDKGNVVMLVIEENGIGRVVGSKISIIDNSGVTLLSLDVTAENSILGVNDGNI